MKTIWFCISLTLLSTVAFAQEPVVPADSVPQDSVEVDSTINDTAAPVRSSDTIIFIPPVFPGETSVTDTIDPETRLRQRPTTALLKSLVIPGWGQAGNGRWFKAIVFAGLQVWFVGEVAHYGRQASDFKNLYERSADVSQRNDYYGLYEDRRQERNKYIFFLGLATLVSVFDAYVDAHLSGAPDAQKIGLQFSPSPDGTHASLTFRF
ncbi:MAG: DUF5683 domain-containing protein [candidate division Zixibacteria bacterium]|nr:DUF5683 domain-containing protein [candidate division Zixibacteria bacterium]